MFGESMTARTFDVRLSPREWTYLRNVLFLPEALNEILASGVPVDGNRYVIKIGSDVAEDFRSVFTDRLAKVGFDQAYEPTQEGQLLEGLIDTFFVGDEPGARSRAPK